MQAGHAVHRFRMGEPKGPVPLPARGAGPPVLPIAAGPASGGEALAAAKAM